MCKRRNNHYVPRWYQKLFLLDKRDQLNYLDLYPEKIKLSNGKEKTLNSCRLKPPSKSFCERDLYTTFLGNLINDEIEVELFGGIDKIGLRAVNAFTNGDAGDRIKNFSNLMLYLDAQKLRTPKGLDWIRKHYSGLDQNSLMYEMQAVRTINCTLWSEGVKEIVSAKDSEIKFIISDHPITIYNYACPPDSEKCSYPDDPSIKYKASQTIFVLDMNNCLILTNYEYAEKPEKVNPIEYRTNANFFRQSFVNSEKIIRARTFNDEDVKKINYIIKSRAKKYIAGREKELHPENDIKCSWSDLKDILLPPKYQLGQFGGEMFMGFEDGTTQYQDAFGRSTPTPKKDYFNLHKKVNNKIRSTDFCGCGSGKKYRKCCRNKKEYERPSWSLKSIRERNIDFYIGIENILELYNGKSWEDVRKEFSNEHVKKIYKLYGFLWPTDTDIISLLPKSDKTLRALYTGLIDPRCISMFAINATLYFEEVVIQSPFLHPQNMRPDYNPVLNPNQFKDQTLKNILLFFTLYPFIKKGYINFIPDPCIFNKHLFQQMSAMAKSRVNLVSIDKKEIDLFETLEKDDFQRLLSSLPRESLKSKLCETNPALTEKELEDLANYTYQKRQEDPLALLQDDVYTKENGQLKIMSLSPNFEISLFLSQIMGAIPITDSKTRWNEIRLAEYREQGVAEYSWQAISKSFNELELAINILPENVFKLREDGALKRTRHVLKKIYLAVQGKYSAQIDEKLSKELIEAYRANFFEIERKEKVHVKAKMKLIIPNGGIQDENIQRLVLMHGGEHCLKKVLFSFLFFNN